MDEIITFLTTFIEAPITSIISLGAIAIFIYWFINIRPKEKIEHDKIIQDYNQTISNYRETIASTTSNYDKSLALCTKVIENNTQVIETITQSVAINNKLLEEYIETNNKMNERIEQYQQQLVNNQHDIQLKIAENN